jgi:hypothetical protein
MPDGTTDYSFVNAAFYDDEAREAGVSWEYDTKDWVVNTVELQTNEELRFTTPLGNRLVFRQTRPEDAAVSTQFPRIRIPLPVDIIGALMTNAITTPTITAAIDDTGDVHTMVLETGMGLYARYARSWIRLTNLGPIEQLEVVDVPPGDLEAYDQADDKGTTINIRDLNPIEAPAITAISVTPAPETVTAGAQFGHNILISSAADLDDAIAYAATDEGAESRWYVTRRARALGHTDPLPWE